MHWEDEGIVVSIRPHGETGAIVELLTRAHGRHLGYAHGARGRSLAPVLQPGNTVRAVWRARLDEQMGTYQVEPVALRSGVLIGSALALYGLATMAALLRALPERDPHPSLYVALDALVARLDDEVLAPPLFVAFEAALLAELGYGLDLEACAVTGARDHLAYVSPRTGRAVSRDAGAPYVDRLLPLPAFLTAQGRGGGASREEVAQGFALTGFFLDRHVFAPSEREPPPERARFIAKALGPAA